VPADLFVTSSAKLQGVQNTPMKPDLGLEVAKIPGVAQVDMLRFYPHDVLGLRVYIISLTPEIYHLRGNPDSREGTLPTPELRAKGYITISENLARRRGLHPGSTFEIDTPTGKRGQQILYPTRPGSVYHMTKSLDQILFQFYAENDGLRITDLHQGIVWGTHTDQTRRHAQLVNRFDYDGDYGTVLNRFLIQAAIGYPLTVHGTGGQTRAFIHIQDSVRCIELALSDAPKRGERVRIFNQMTETHRVRDLAELVSRLTGAKVAYLPNPRKEAEENDLIVKNDQFLALGLNPIRLEEGLLAEVVDVAKKFAHRIDRSRVPAVSAWTKEIAARVDRDPEHLALRPAS
jgi:nucleoside-diphosphate-sugar epimerase